MILLHAVLRIVGLWAIFVGLTACYSELGDAKSAAELAPSLDALREVAPEHHQRLADGTFDSLSFLEQWDFVGEVVEIARMRYENNQAELEPAWRRAWTARRLEEGGPFRH